MLFYFVRNVTAVIAVIFKERNLNYQENVSVKKEFCNSQRELSNAFVWD